MRRRGPQTYSSLWTSPTTMQGPWTQASIIPCLKTQPHQSTNVQNQVATLMTQSGGEEHRQVVIDSWAIDSTSQPWQYFQETLFSIWFQRLMFKLLTTSLQGSLPVGTYDYWSAAIVDILVNTMSDLMACICRTELSTCQSWNVHIDQWCARVCWRQCI